MPTTYNEIATASGLDETTAGRYVTYMRTRWPEEEQLECQTGYAQEWAERFKAGREYQASDAYGQGVLRRLDPGRYEPCRA